MAGMLPTAAPGPWEQARPGAGVAVNGDAMCGAERAVADCGPDLNEEVLS